MSTNHPRTVLITGSSSGFGLALTRHFLQHGWNVVATSRNPASTPDLVSEVTSHPSGRGRWLRLDVCDSQERIDQVVAEAEKAFGDREGEGEEQMAGLDVVINNAGYSILGPLETVDEEKARGMMDANFWGTLKVCKATIPGLRLGRSRQPDRPRWIVNFSSIAGINANANVGVYAASKFAVEAISESLAQELAPFGIECLLVEPGMFRTNFFNAGGDASADAKGSGKARGNASYHLAPLPVHYKDTPVETSHNAFANASEGKQRGDVHKAAERVREVVEGRLVIGGEKGKVTGVKRMVLGPDAFQRAEKALREKLEGVLAGEAVAASTDRDDVDAI